MAGNKLPKGETEKRIQTVYDLRFNNNEAFTITDWIKYCHENYGDKSEQQYTAYFVKASERHKEGWKELLEKQLTPATEELIRLLGDESPKVRADAVKMIYRYTGNEIIKQQIEGSIEVVKVKWTDDE